MIGGLKNMIDRLKKFLATIPLGLLIVSGAALALWLVLISGSSHLTVYSSEGIPLVLTSNFAGANINTTLSDQNVSDVLTFNNENGPIVLKVNITQVKADSNLGDTCSNYESDCNSSYYFNDFTPINNGGNISVATQSANHIKMVTLCKRYSCSQSVDTTIRLTPISN
jgi:hypothetical protein